MNGQNRSDIKIGAKVKIVLKADQTTGKLTEGTVGKILTNSSFHPHGIKVMLIDGQVGRVKEIIWLKVDGIDRMRKDSGIGWESNNRKTNSIIRNQHLYLHQRGLL